MAYDIDALTHERDDYLKNGKLDRANQVEEAAASVGLELPARPDLPVPEAKIKQKAEAKIKPPAKPTE